MGRLNIEIAPTRYSDSNKTFDLTVEAESMGWTKTNLTVQDLINLRDTIDEFLNGR
jgi:hypothetical protein